ncbi:MAG: DNA/RNA non-specific endonuclease [Chitinophagaceae bacterium]
MNLKIILVMVFFTMVLSCIKLPCQQFDNNEKILSVGKEIAKPISVDVIFQEGNFPENSALYLGMPSLAITHPDSSYNNYLIHRKYLTISYNKTKDIPNWVAWHLSKSDLGTQERTNRFLPDPLLPFEWIWIETSSYTNSNFDRGHSCPSGDRTVDERANIETFYMTNIIPQAPNFNQRPWATLEDFIRTILKNNHYEAYIYNGTCGIGGFDKNNEFARKIKNNIGRKHNDGSYDSICVPKYVFKIVIFLSEGKDDSARIMANNGDDVKVLAVFCPNDNKLNNNSDWQKYITNIQSIEDSILIYQDIEEANKYSTRNPLNPPMSFLSKIPDGVIKDKLKTKKWDIVH